MVGKNLLDAIGLLWSSVIENGGFMSTFVEILNAVKR